MLETIGASKQTIANFERQARAALERKHTRALEYEPEAPDLDRPAGTDAITVASGFGQLSRRGFVDFTLNEVRTQMPADKAREVGLMLLEAAEAAESDEIFVKLLEKTGLPAEAAGRMLLELRELRQGTRGTSWPS
jgi:hypothetical protein